MNEIQNYIKIRAEEIMEEINAIRRHIHMHPELSFQEYETSAFIRKTLDNWNVAYRSDIVKTGILATIEGEKPGRTVALRADMDALPIHETNQVEYRSVKEGVMHACGHDVHTSCLLGAIRILSGMKDRIEGTLLFVFQPGEERIPGGAKLMLEEDLFREKEPDFMIAQHVFPEMDSGEAGFRPGIYMASSDEIFITVKGKGGHAALPEKITDTVLIASHIIVALQQVVSRRNSPGIPSVLSFGKVEAAGAVNIIPNEVKIEGTFRTMNEQWRGEAHGFITDIATKTAEAMGGKADVEIRKGYPVLENHPKLTDFASSKAREYLGQDKVRDLNIRMTAEDFAYFSQKYPSLMYRLGVAEPGSVDWPSLHTPGFNIHENALKTGIELMTWLGYSTLMAKDL